MTNEFRECIFVDIGTGATEMPGKKFTVSTQENNVGCEMVIEVWVCFQKTCLIHGVGLVSWRDCGVGMACMLTLPSKAMADITNQTQMTSLIRPTCFLCIHLNRGTPREPLTINQKLKSVHHFGNKNYGFRVLASVV